MKTIISRTLLAFAISLVAGMGVFAQSIASLPTYSIIADSSSKADTVSIGATMPYFVRPDAAIKKSPLYNASGFAWTISGTGATITTTLTGSPVAASGYYTDTLVNAKFASLGDVTISTMERSNPKFNALAGCDGNLRTQTINVMNLPSIPTIANADTAQGGCSAAAPYTVKFNFSLSTVKFPVYVAYTIRYYNINNVAAGTPQSAYYKINSATENVIISQAQLDLASGTTNAKGRYTVTLGNMWDRISVRSTDGTTLAKDASSVYAAIMLFPAPVTQPINHIKTI